MANVRLNVPWTGLSELSAVSRVVASGFLTQGPVSERFESLVARHVGVDHAFAVSSATTGLHLSLAAIGVGPGDEVVVPDFSFPATANVVEQIGAVPRFVDIEPQTFNLDPSRLRMAIGNRTKAVMPVHAFGLAADMGAISGVASEFGLPVVEDAACALTATIEGRQAGSLGDVGVFSFHPRKIITTGEGGMITTNDPRIAERISLLRSHGGLRGEFYMQFVEAGFNYRLSDIHAALGVAQMARLERIRQKRYVLARTLIKLLRGIQEVTPPAVPAGSRHSFQSFVVRLSPRINRDQVIREMRALGVETTLGTYALHLQPYYRAKYRLSDADFPHATSAHLSALSLPLHPRMTQNDLRRVVRALEYSILRSKTGSG